MIAKRSLGCDLRDVPINKRFRRDLSDAMLANELSAARIGSLASNATLAGAAHVGDLGTRGTGANPSRDLIRRLLKGSQWPEPYFAAVEVVNPTTNDVEEHYLPFMLPHEVIHNICRLNANRVKTHRRDLLDSRDLEHLNLVEQATQAPPGSLLGVGLWLDGVTTKWDRSQSLDVVTLAFPGWAGEFKNVRIPLFAIEHRFVRKVRTSDRVLEVLRWSLTQAFVGQFPTGRHDGQPWMQTDTRRKKRTGALSTKASLCRVMGAGRCGKKSSGSPSTTSASGSVGVVGPW